MRNSALQEITLPDINGGINVHDPEYDIADNQSPDMLNLWYKDMALCKRPGQTQLCCRSDVYRVSALYNGARVLHAGTKLCRWNADGMERYAGEFDPAAGYPAGVNAGDYCIASAAGTLRGVSYEAGDAAIYGGVQVVSATVAGVVTAAGDASVTITGAELANTPLSIGVPVELDDTAAEVAEKVRTALSAEAAVTALYTVGGTESAVTLTQKAAGEQDKTLAFTVGNGTCAGLTAVASTDASVWHNTITEISTGIADSAGVFCEFGDTLYYIDGAEIWQVNADYTVAAVEPYVPVVMINTAPDRSESSDNEAYNLIGPGFTVWYNGTGASTVNYYVLSATQNTFTVKTSSGGTTALNITSNGTPGWKVRKQGASWISGTPAADSGTDTITLAGHGLLAGDTIQFDHGTGTLPGGISACGLIYHLPQSGLDSAAVQVSVDVRDLTEGTHFTVNRTEGTVDFSGGTTAHGVPAKGTNNVWITAYKTAYETDGTTPKRKRVTGCKAAVRFGGETAGVTGGTRVFVMGNPAFPYHYWRSDLGLHVSAGMAYFPDTSEELLDQNSEAITATAKMGDELIIFKENSIFAVGYSFDGEEVYYPVRECHSMIGCDMPGSVQLIDNRLVFAHSKSGVYMLVSSDNDLENIVKPLSANINRLLLKEENLKQACSCDMTGITGSA